MARSVDILDAFYCSFLSRDGVVLLHGDPIGGCFEDVVGDYAKSLLQGGEFRSTRSMPSPG